MTHMSKQLVCAETRQSLQLEYKQQEQQLMLCIRHARTPQPHRTSHTAPHGAGCGVWTGDCARGHV